MSLPTADSLFAKFAAGDPYWDFKELNVTKEVFKALLEKIKSSGLNEMIIIDMYLTRLYGADTEWYLEIFKMLCAEELKQVRVRFGRETFYEYFNTAMSRLSSEEKLILDGRVILSYHWQNPFEKKLESYIERVTTLVEQTDSWKKNVDFGLEGVVTETVRKHIIEDEAKGDDSFVDNCLLPKTILGQNGKDDFEWDGLLFIPKKHTLCIVETKQTLSEGALSSANKTKSSFEKFVSECWNPGYKVPATASGLYKQQMATLYSELPQSNGPPTLRFYLGANSWKDVSVEEKRKKNPTGKGGPQKAFKAIKDCQADGWTVVQRNGSDFHVI